MHSDMIQFSSAIFSAYSVAFFSFWSKLRRVKSCEIPFYLINCCKLVEFFTTFFHIYHPPPLTWFGGNHWKRVSWDFCKSCCHLARQNNLFAINGLVIWFSQQPQGSGVIWPLSQVTSHVNSSKFIAHRPLLPRNIFILSARQ